ncbi:MAG: HEAT repeat domain-containing protein [Gemmataceae bacterium]
MIGPDTTRAAHRLAGGAALGLLTLALAASVGCRNLDDFHWKKMNFEVFRDPENPMEVIRSSKDGNERARALRCLQEPLTHGGTQQDQDAVVAVLNYSASHESQLWCRLAAIDSLRKFKDPRAADGMKEAYYHAGIFNPEQATVIRCQALTGLGETRQPAAVEVLVRVLREPPVEGPDQDKELKMRERIAAAKALRGYPDQQATGALVEVLRREKDDALRNNAHESLVASTGKRLPPDGQVWADYFENPSKVDPSLVQQPNLGERILELTGLK